MWNSSMNSTLEVEFAGEVGRGERIGEQDEGDIEGGRGDCSGEVTGE